MLDMTWPLLHLGARILFGVALMMTSMGHFTSSDTSAGDAATKGVPSPKAAVVLSGIMVWVGAVLIILGWHRFIGAGLVILFLIPVSIKMHGYWAVTDPMARMMDKTAFWKNVGLLGGVMFVAYYSRWEWPLSLGG